jgi:hypothetical protein
VRLFKDERDFTRWVLHEARSRYWLAAHLGNVQIVRGKGGIPVAIPDKDAAGFPDLVLVHHDHGVIWAELKMPTKAGKPGRLRQEQIIWLATLREAHERVYVWGPDDQREIEEVLDGNMSTARLFDEVRT